VGRARIVALAGASWLALAAAGAGAETYRIVSGELTDAATGETEALAGAFEAWLWLEELQWRSLGVGDFELRAGPRSFTPSPPIEFEGLTPILSLFIADQIRLDGDDVVLLHLRSGGEVVAASETEVTFRFLDFLSDAFDGGRAAGYVGDTALPQRFRLAGTLYEVDQTFRIVRAGPVLVPPPSPLPPPDGGGVVIAGGGSVLVASDRTLISLESFDIAAAERVTFAPPAGGTVSFGRVTGGAPSTLDGALLDNGSVHLRSVLAFDFAATSSPVVNPFLVAGPTLEDLGIQAPNGAQVTFDDAGVLTVTSEGDLFIEGGVIDLPGLTSLVIVAGGEVVVEGQIVLPPGVTLRIDSGSVVVDPGPVIFRRPPGVPVLDHLRPVFPAVQREVGSFAFVASAVQPMDVDVKPGRDENRVRPGRRQKLSVAILGSEAFDVRDVDEDSLRLGPDEAEPKKRPRRRDVNDDGHRDLVARFDVSETGIAFGDSELCLVAETTEGVLLEGCDAIETWPEPKLKAARSH
jgi:hypothetical protein